MKTITFTQFNKEDYEILCEGLLGSSRPINGIAEMRLQKRIFDKLGEIGEVKKESNSKYLMKLKNGNAEYKINLEDAEWEFGKELLDKVQWLRDGALKALSAVELWHNASAEEIK